MIHLAIHLAPRFVRPMKSDVKDFPQGKFALTEIWNPEHQVRNLIVSIILQKAEKALGNKVVVS